MAISHSSFLTQVRNYTEVDSNVLTDTIIQEFNVTTNGITTTIHSMVPEDPSVQNRRRILLSSIGSVEVSIT